MQGWNVKETIELPDPSKIVAIDSETFLIENGKLAPKLVCVSTFVNGVATVIHAKDPAWETSVKVLLKSGRLVATANGAFDAAVWLANASDYWEMWEALRDCVLGGRWYDVQIAEAEHAISLGLLGHNPHTGERLITGRYSLETLCKIELGEDTAKENDAYRLRYGELYDLPLDQWPAEALQYPKDDVINTYRVAKAQHETHHANRHDVSSRGAVALALHLGACRGFTVDLDACDEIDRAVESATKELVTPLINCGFLRDDLSVDTKAVKAAVVKAYGKPKSCREIHTCSAKCKKVCRLVGSHDGSCKACEGTELLDASGTVPKTDAGRISISRDVLEDSGDDLLLLLAEYKESEKIRSTYLPYLRGE